MRAEHGTSAAKPTLRSTLADGSNQYVRHRNKTSQGPRWHSSTSEIRADHTDSWSTPNVVFADPTFRGS
jgi:hypothetical protein